MTSHSVPFRRSWDHHEKSNRKESRIVRQAHSRQINCGCSLGPMECSTARSWESGPCSSPTSIRCLVAMPGCWESGSGSCWALGRPVSSPRLRRPALASPRSRFPSAQPKSTGASVEANAKPPSQNDRHMRSATWDRNSFAIPRRMRTQSTRKIAR